jgi:hypothetical protein
MKFGGISTFFNVYGFDEGLVRILKRRSFHGNCGSSI